MQSGRIRSGQYKTALGQNLQPALPFSKFPRLEAARLPAKLKRDKITYAAGRWSGWASSTVFAKHFLDLKHDAALRPPRNPQGGFTLAVAQAPKR